MHARIFDHHLYKTVHGLGSSIYVTLLFLAALAVCALPTLVARFLSVDSLLHLCFLGNRA
jgi:hypothetical protein